MLPPSFSSHEIYSKHRNPEEIQEIERQNRIAETRAYQYGDPVNSSEQYSPEPSPVEQPLPKRKPRLAVLILRFVNFFLTG
jgi:hypothetical protein